MVWLLLLIVVVNNYKPRNQITTYNAFVLKHRSIME